MQRRKSSPSLNVDPITATIKQLNHDWLLGLPLSPASEGRVPRQHAGVSEIQLVTSRCLQVLFWFSTQPTAPNFQKILDDFEEVAKPLVSEWISKPSQQHGSLASLPRTKSLLSKELSVQRKEKKARLELPEHRVILLSKLVEVLSEHQELSFSSADYELQSPPKPEVKPSMAFNGVTSSRKSSKSSVTKKRSSSAVASGDATTSKQPKISDLFGPRLTSVTPVNELAVPNPMSFNSAVSPEQPSVFTPPLQDSTSSNETSLLSINDKDELFPTQDVADFDADPMFKTSFHELDTATSLSDDPFSTLKKSGPFSQPCQIPGNIPFHIKYETHRVAGSLGLYPLDFWKRIRRICKTEIPTSEQLWQAIREIAREANIPAPLSSSGPAWAAASDIFQDSHGQTVTLSGSLTWADAKKKNIFDFQLKPLRLEKSCRLHRRFGADRFLVVSLPYFTRLPSHLRNKSTSDGTSYSKQVSNWLAQSTHRICGREWRSFFLEADKKKSKDVQKGLKVYLFAVNGIDFMPRPVMGAFPGTEWRNDRTHVPMTVGQLLQWHLRPSEHLSSTDLKLFSRFSLGLSKTFPTVVLRPGQFVVLESPRGKAVMNDGCAMMSLDMAKEVARQLGLSELPTAFQGRIGGAKGLWTVDYHNSHSRSGLDNFWIEVSDSQLKIQPHPLHYADANDEQRCFEVLKYSKSATQSQLNTQYINILDHHQIAKGVLDVALRHDIKEYTESFKQAAKDSRRLLSWLYRYHRPGRGNELPRSAGAFPRSTEEQAVMLLESGFRVADCPLLAEKFNTMLTQTLDNYVERLHIKVAMSTTVFCVADPYGVLEPREVYIGLTGRYENPVTHVPENGVFGIDVLVARNPAHLPSDMQKVKAVFHEKLRNFKDVIVFSTKGDQPLASLLSGGDYDGDTVFVCWDQSFVQKFENANLPQNLPTPAECGIEERSQKLGQVFARSAGSLSGVEYLAECDDFLTRCFWFNCQAPLLGHCVLEHEKFIYHRDRMSSAPAMKLATLAGYLVDANKQGYFLSESAWSRIRKEVSGERALQEPAYRTGHAPALRTKGGYYHRYSNVIDWLKFDVAASRKTEVLTELGKHRNTDSDAQLKVFWTKALAQADEEAKIARSDKDKDPKALQAILNDLKERIRDLGDQWSAKTASKKSFAAIGATDNVDGDKFQQAVEYLHREFLAIAPLESVKHPLVEQWKREEDQEHSNWQTLKASCLYKNYSLGKISWYLAGKSLCKIKADVTRNTRTLTSEMYSVLKPDRRLVERMAATTMNFDVDDARDDEYLVEEDDGNVMESWVY